MELEAQPLLTEVHIPWSRHLRLAGEFAVAATCCGRLGLAALRADVADLGAVAFLARVPVPSWMPLVVNWVIPHFRIFFVLL